MGLFVVRYDYREGSAASQDEHRATHRDWLASQHGLRAGGRTDDNGAYLIFEAADAAEVSALLPADPFAIEGVIERTQISGWAIPLGTWRDPLGL